MQNKKFEFEFYFIKYMISKFWNLEIDLSFFWSIQNLIKHGTIPKKFKMILFSTTWFVLNRAVTGLYC